MNLPMKSKNLRYDQEKFFQVDWTNLSNGDMVWIKGKHIDTTCFYGPHEVVSAKRRILKNKYERQFMHYPDDLCIEIPS